MAGILCIQIDSEFGNKEVNKKKIEKILDENSQHKLDLVLFPEFFSTSTAYRNFPEDENGGQTIEWACNLAKKYNTNIIAGTIVRKVSDKFYNTSFAISRNGEILAKYDKIHLYNYTGGKEGTFNSPGDKIVTVDFDFARVGMAICFDIRYPLHFNKLIKKEVDIIALPTAWLIPTESFKNGLETVREMWVSMLRTRAYDNMVYFAVCNQFGKATDAVWGIGDSMIISPEAEILAKIENGEGAIYSEIQIEKVKELRKTFPIAKID